MLRHFEFESFLNSLEPKVRTIVKDRAVYMFKTSQPGVSTASWEVTGVLYRGGVIKLPRARSARVFSPPQARKFWRY